MFDKILIANRGEIALRVVRACRELGVRSVAVYSTPDADAQFVRAADEAVHIGPAAAARSYLNIPNVVGAALRTGAQAIHPGYGFLSEDPYFAEICAQHGLTFIGPPPRVMEAAGNKAVTRRLMAEAGLPLLPGTVDPVGSVDEALAVARGIGYPVIVKAAAGGGGRGISVVHRPQDMRREYLRTRANALAVFRDSAVYIERYLDRARHIEVQVVCDAHGGAVHLGERDCSVQRRHQKLVEEGPSPRVDAALRQRLGDAALAGVKALDYRGLGTMEFLMDDSGDFWFMEMNARIQVEHPVTELITGVDLVHEQLAVAAGYPLSLAQSDVVLRGHAVQMRVNAEDPARGFAPAPGRLETFRPPAGPWTRVDTAYGPGDAVSAHYDSMVAKLLVWAPDRDRALDRGLRALDEFAVSGPGLHTTVPFHRRVLRHPVFRAGDATTDFLTRHLDAAAA